jgi:acetylornithine deacetylase
MELSTYPDSCRLQIERRTVPGEPATLVQEQVQAVLDEAVAVDPTVRAELWMGLVREPFGVAEDEAIVQLLRAQATSVLGQPPPLTGAGGWMDSALLAAAGIPTVVFGPAGHGHGAHADEEWVDLASLGRCYEILLETVRVFCA